MPIDLSDFIRTLPAGEQEAIDERAPELRRAWARLNATMDAASKEAERNGLTDTTLEALLADES